MKIKILQKNGCAILAVLCLIGLCLPFVDAYNGAERSIYSYSESTYKKCLREE